MDRFEDDLTLDTATPADDTSERVIDLDAAVFELSFESSFDFDGCWHVPR